MSVIGIHRPLVLKIICPKTHIHEKGKLVGLVIFWAAIVVACVCDHVSCLMRAAQWSHKNKC